MTRVAVVGAGYVGITTAGCFSHLGHEVVCADIDAERVARLSRGEVPILEAGLPELIKEGIEGGRLRFVVGGAAAVRGAEVVYLCVPTPQADDGSADLSYIEQAARDISDALESEAIVVNKSTVPVGSTRVVERTLGRTDIAVVSNPEFLREGSAVHDFLHPDRIVIGADDQSAAMRVAALFDDIQAPMIITDPATAETIKYASNAFLATKVSFANAMSAVCEAVGADVRDVMLGMGYDRRIGSDFLKPGPGYGGSCFPKDTKALVHIAAEAGYDFHLLRGVIDVNAQQFGRIADKARRLVGGSVEGVKMAAWGLTFKARTDDIRDSPALEVIGRLSDDGAKITCFDPAAPEVVPGVDHRAADPYAAAEGAELAMVLTEWDELRWIDLERLAGVMATPRILDARNLLDPAQVRRAGFVYEGVGRR